MRLYIIRHADPDYGNDSLTPSGHLEAKALAQRMVQIQPDRIFCSPKGRAVATAQCTSDLLGTKLEIEQWTREMDCRFDHPRHGRLMVWDCPGEDLRSDDALRSGAWHELEFFRDPSIREAVEQLHRDSDRFLTSLGYVRQKARYRAVSGNELRIAMFCHGGFGLTWLAHLLHLPLPLAWSGFWLSPASITTILFEHRSDDWAIPRCIGLGDIAHLNQAGLKRNYSGLKANTE